MIDFKISPCEKFDYHQIVDIEKNLFEFSMTQKDLEIMAVQEAFKIWKIHTNCILGYVSFFQVKDEVEIIKIAIIKSHQSRGYGSYLIQQLKSLPISKIFIEVSYRNKPAINFYMKNGFNKIGTRKNYYISKNNKRLDAIRMTWKIS